MANLIQLSYTRQNKNIKIRHNHFMKYKNFTRYHGKETPVRVQFPDILG